MKPPTRLLDDPELSADLRADLQTVVHHPHQVDLQRAAGALAAAIGSSAISATGHASASTAPAASSAGALSALPLALKVTLAAVGGAALIGLAVVQLQPSAPSDAPVSRPAARAPLQRAAPQPPAAAVPAAIEITPEPPATTPAGPSASRREIAQLRRIQRLLASDPAAAQRVAEASQREFPHGALREEREGLSVLALFKLADRPQALQKAQRFLDRYPQSPLAERIRELVAREPSP